MGFDNGLPGTSLEVVSAIVIVFCVVGTVALAIRWVVNRRRKVSAAKGVHRRLTFRGTEEAMRKTVCSEGDVWIIPTSHGSKVRVVQPGRHRRR